ncbi:hypothetical protein TrVFT333_002016 [Trichoderma virens FT-333]|nr:hypothetical protein TrVFT333_002016 [Trichoderma virens FT-333]
MPTTSSPGLGTGSYRRSTLPLSLIRHGGGLVGCGMLFGFLVPLVPYPRLGLTAHIQFGVQGCMVLVAGLVLQSDPLGSSRSQDGDTETSGQRIQLADRLSWWQEQAIYWGCTTIWATMIAEVGNAWWGTRGTLPIAHQAAGLLGGPEAARWMEMFMAATHFPLAFPLASVWPIILSKLW